ncbi:transcriptional regulator [uncultured Friedmanniella sp.]|uniref:transcriptional regulator n=1 Tax=uncultured Friedmanniella sp. TaxID=335381 RepID=UPI0035CA8461
MTVEPQFDEVIHAPQRIKVCALLSSVDTLEFGVIRDHLGVADSVASKHLKVLTDAGYVQLTKPLGQQGRAKTWVRMTAAGRHAFQGHLAALHQMVEQASGALALDRQD